jgi:hypothetical protein
MIRGQDAPPTLCDEYGWDTHNDIFPSLREHLLPRLDWNLSALLEDLDERGLLAQTLDVCMGEFGRAPRIALEPGFAGSIPRVLKGRRQRVGGSPIWPCFRSAREVLAKIHFSQKCLSLIDPVFRLLRRRQNRRMHSSFIGTRDVPSVFATPRGAARSPLRGFCRHYNHGRLQGACGAKKSLQELFHFCKKVLDSRQSPIRVVPTSEPIEGLGRVSRHSRCRFVST